ncbi:hypothetical protein BP5796_11171 [Coleophoma crateriformis]|uniref:Bromodomain-containing protein n=1 Tax=Coleophoma crateriformis TaxID=565419 RepID=A0A3D8QM43_9HELO|nr:hypothetical protein BP5796_11171 [Coleophoma crateriformis]
MTSEQSEGVTFEQKTQPVPSSEKMALDLDINGTSNRDETNLEPAPDASLNDKSATSSSNELTASTVEVNGSSNDDAFKSNNIVASSIDPPPEEFAPAVDLSFSDLPETTVAQPEPSTSSDAHPLASDLASAPVDSAIDAAVEDHLGASSVLPVIEPQESDLRDQAPPQADPMDDTKPKASASSEPELASRSKDELEIDATMATTSISNEQPSASLKDTDMADAPTISQVSKNSREREDDDDEVEPLAKRTKTEERAPTGSLAAQNNQKSAVNGDDDFNDVAITPYQTKEIIKAVKLVVRSNNGKNFRLPVAQLWPNFAEEYKMRIPNEIDLGTIEQRVRTRYYSGWAAFRADVNLLANNALTFNGPDHSITLAADEVRQSLLSKTANIPAEIVQAPKPSKKVAPKHPTPTAETAPRHTPTARRGSKSSALPVAPQGETFALDPSGVPLIRRGSTKLDGGRPKREIHPPKNKDLPYNSTRPKSKKNATELKFCEHVLTELKKQKYWSFTGPFLQPVDPVALGVPNYFSIIKTPMDLQTITDRLNQGQYQKSKDFESDVRLIFANCYKFNPTGNPVHDMGKQTEDLFNGLWDKKQQWIIDHAPAAQSPSSDMESDEEESEEEAENEPAAAASTSGLSARLIDEQQKLISMMTQKNADKASIEVQQTICEMLQRKVNEEAAASSAKKSSKKAKPAMAKPTKKSSTVIKKEKAGTTTNKKSGSRAKYMGTVEKEIVSAGIGLLPESTQDRVLQIIQGDAPDAKADDDGSLELDIESLTEASLWEIYGMIEKHLPGTVKTIRDQKDAERIKARGPTQPKQKKKNKPMSKNEQERKIEHLKNAVQELERHGSGSQEPVMPTVEQQDESSGDESSDSEEE